MKILIVDDERSIRNSLKEILSDEGYDVDVAEDGATALAMVDKERYNVIFCDIKMPGMDGTEVLDKMVAEGIDSAIVMISGHGDIDTAVECIKKGAFDFIQKPLDLNRILITIKNASEKATIISENKTLKKKVYGQRMIGESEPIRHERDITALRARHHGGRRPQRFGQGAGCAESPRAERQKRDAVHRGELCGHPVGTD